MGHKKGAHLGAVATLDDLMGRCVVDQETGCWHLRSARGRPMPKGVHQINAYPGGKTTATRLAWQLAHPTGRIPPGWKAYRCCQSYDCVAPGHLRIGTPKAIGLHWARAGTVRTPAKVEAGRIAGLSQSKLTPELRRWLIESSQPAAEIADALGISAGRACAIRREARKAAAKRPAASVFEFAMKVAA